MANTREAIENVKSVARVFQSVIDLATTLEGLANVEQALAETQSRMRKLADEATRAEAVRDAAKGDAALTLEHAAQVKANADQVLEEAERTAAEKLRAAEIECTRMLLKTKDQCANDVVVAEQEMLEIHNKRDAAKAELADLEAKIERARAKMRDILGA